MQNRIGWCNKYIIRLFFPILINNEKDFVKGTTLKKVDLSVRGVKREAIIPIQKTISQFVNNVKWGELEIMVVDLPPGTGDAQLSLAQTIPLSGAIIVTTPQLASTQVAKRGARMLEKTNVPILGVVENMSYFLDQNREKQAIFGEGGGEKTASDLETQLLGGVPLDPEIREAGDEGTPLSLAKPNSPTSESFNSIAEKILEKLGQQKS